MNTQLYLAMKTPPFEAVAGIKPPFEPESTLIVDEPADDSEDNTDLNDRSCDTKFVCRVVLEQRRHVVAYCTVKNFGGKNVWQLCLL